MDYFLEMVYFCIIKISSLFIYQVKEDVGE